MLYIAIMLPPNTKLGAFKTPLTARTSTQVILIMLLRQISPVLPSKSMNERFRSSFSRQELAVPALEKKIAFV